MCVDVGVGLVFPALGRHSTFTPLSPHPQVGEGDFRCLAVFAAAAAAVLSQSPPPIGPLPRATREKTKSLNAFELSATPARRGKKREREREEACHIVSRCCTGGEGVGVHLRRPTSEAHNYKCIN